MKLEFRRPKLLAVAILAMALAISLPAIANHAQYYVLDGFGGVHAGGGAPAISPATPYFGFDIAQDLVFVPVGESGLAGDGVLVLDGFGGVHPGGQLAFTPPSPATPYFGFNVARAITYRNIPPRAAGYFSSLALNAGLGDGWIVVGQATMFAPDDGFIMINGTTEVSCDNFSTGGLVGELGFAVDSSTPDRPYQFTFDECSDLVNGTNRGHTQIATVTGLVPVAAGAHIVQMLGQMIAGNVANTADFDWRSLAIVFIDQGNTGTS